MLSHIENLNSDVFKVIVADCSYNPTLANLSMTSKAMQEKVFKLPCGELVEDLNELQPSYLRAFFAKPYRYPIFAIGMQSVVGIIGSMMCETYLGSYFGALAGISIGGVLAGAVASGVSGSMEDFKNTVSFAVKSYKITGISAFKMSYKIEMNIAETGFDLLAKKVHKSFDFGKGLISSFGNIVEESPKQVFRAYVEECGKAYLALNMFTEKNIQYLTDLENQRKPIQEELSKPNARKHS